MAGNHQAIPVVVALVLRNERVLMGKRKPHKIYADHWEFPGGKVEANESLFEALQRELHEELSINIEAAEEWFQETAKYAKDMVYDIHYFLVRAWESELIDNEFAEIGWFSVTGLQALQHLTGNARILRKLYREGLPQ